MKDKIREAVEYLENGHPYKDILSQDDIIDAIILLDKYLNKKKKRPEFVQILNPKTKRYVKINKTIGDIVSHKKSKGPYKNIPIRRRNEKINKLG